MTLKSHFEAAIELYPAISPILSHRSKISQSTWETGIYTGKSIEVLSLCGLLSAAAAQKFTILIPPLYFDQPDLFYLRNVVPSSHGAQAGHDATLLDEISLLDRFFAALTPKAIIENRSGARFLVFREGLPPHFISLIARGGAPYLERPDYAIMNGDYDIQQQGEGLVSFLYKSKGDSLAGSLRVKNDATLPLKNLSSNFARGIEVSSIIECSVGKTRIRAEDQLATYVSLLECTSKPFSVLVNAQNKPCSAYDQEIPIDATSEASELISKSFADGFQPLISHLDRYS